ncbi:MAG: transcription antitermination factor NusB [Clostridia bacterium]|nr:transcription antitermination factor NusB [Clostridia bacterium]
MNRSQVRELAFKLLYQIEIQKEVNNEDIDLFFENNQISSKEAKEYIEDVVNGVSKEAKTIMEEIEKNLKKDWEIDRISKINLALLKLAIYEIKYKDLPFKVVINEVVELAKKYGEETSSVFINGILASVVKEA